MAFSASFRHFLLLVSTMVYITVSTCKFGAVADEYVPPVEGDVPPVEGDAGEYVPPVEGTAGEYVPPAEGTYPHPVFDKALECFDNKHIYSSCEETHRLTQEGELHVPPEYTDHYCNGPCLAETHLVLDCIDGIVKHFVFYNRATLKDVRKTIDEGCSYGPKRGDFNVAEHIQADEAVANRMPSAVLCALVLMFAGWRVLL